MTEDKDKPVNSTTKVEVVTIYDPPSGWQFGFPKQYLPLDPQEPLATTLLRDGYPKKLIDQGMDKHVRFWSQPVEIKENK
jgi:hypothetical protein